MRIVQITDLHIGQEGEDTFGVDVRKNFLKIIDAVTKLQPDHLVVSGDLCYRVGELAIYQWIKNHLDGLNLPYDLISGNHDDPVLMANVFALEQELKKGELYFTKKVGTYTVLFMDTTTGWVSDEQLRWLGAQLGQLNERAIIFMHHPPLSGGVPFMDQEHALKNKEAVQEILFQHPYQICIFTGHYHVEKTITKQNVTVQITPSCFFQIDQHSSEFKVDHHRIGLREITLENGTLMNTVRYL